MKYWIIGVVALVVSVFYFIHQNNKADSERLKQVEIAYKQKISQEKAAEVQVKKDIAEQKAQAELSRIKENEFVAQKQSESQKAQITLAETKVREKLLDPDSAKFRNQNGNCGEVNSKNRMGGYVGFSRYIYFPDDGTVAIESDASDSIYTANIMNSLWKAKCS
ncbi:hypothetical protein ACG92Y_12385 [Acinetobacter ursingii]|uniref:hypothetical protein n=1 Tax=Acinetobacter ursingii TaxID=108980 RepID=UPI003AF68181